MKNLLKKFVAKGKSVTQENKIYLKVAGVALSVSLAVGGFMLTWVLSVSAGLAKAEEAINNNVTWKSNVESFIDDTGKFKIDSSADRAKLNETCSWIKQALIENRQDHSEIKSLLKNRLGFTDGNCVTVVGSTSYGD